MGNATRKQLEASGEFYKLLKKTFQEGCSTGYRRKPSNEEYYWADFGPAYVAGYVSGTEQWINRETWLDSETAWEKMKQQIELFSDVHSGFLSGYITGYQNKPREAERGSTQLVYDAGYAAGAADRINGGSPNAFSALMRYIDS